MSYVRKEVIGNATLYLGDALRILPALDRGLEECGRTGSRQRFERGGGENYSTIRT